ncbi:MAG: carboxypeptidase regulatory-like domain-containing protein [Bacteroidales bacterium]|nr:carboxypeptidase regulatory-like domain-containing protein [Bacteroidales bacterium]
MKIFRYFVLVIAAIVSCNVIAQESQKELGQLMQSRGEYYFSLPVSQVSEIQTINQLCSVDKTDGQTAICYANQQQFDRLIKQGYQPTLMTPPSMLQKAVMWDGSHRDTYEWDEYPTYEAYESMMYQFATDHPDKCEVFTLGTLPSGRKIFFAHINNGQPEGKPKFLYTSTIHGDETTGWMLMLRLIDYILENPTEPEVQYVLDNIDLYISPLTNPDGTYHGGNNNVNGATRYNANGVDMNRNYPDPNSGPHPDGEPYQQETQWLMDFAQETPFVMGANYHGGAEVVNYPWDNTYTIHADDAWFQLTAHEYAELAQEMHYSYMTELNDGITNGAQWYMIGGGRQDYMNGYAECREVTIECSDTKLPYASQMPTFWNYNKNSMFAFMKQCTYGIHGVVTDKDNGQPLEAVVSISGHDNEFSTVSSHLPAGDYHRPIKGGTYTVTFTANGYYPHQETVTVADGETVTLNVELEAGEGIIPDFNANPSDVALHGSVNFTDQTWGANLVSWQWNFPGGNPSSSTEQNPSGIVYDAVGSYPVTLTVSNADGDTETVTKQDFIHVSESYNMQNGTIETCSALFYDDGGPSSNYSSQATYTLTFVPGVEGAMIQVSFSEFDLENNYDFLEIFNGNSTSAPSFGDFSGSDSPGTVTANNETGALTFKFSSDYSVTHTGWTATVTCSGVDMPLTVTATADPEVINEGEISQLLATASGGSGGYTYLWEPGETLDYPSLPSPVASPVVPTEYTVTVTDSEGNTASASVTVDIRDVNVEENTLAQVKVYPIPSEGNITIQGIQGETQYRLINSLGQTVVSGTCDSDITISENLSSGVYFLRLSNSDEVSTLKITVK